MHITASKARDELDNSQEPLFLFDDDCDGLCSFLQMYRYKKEGKFQIVKGRPTVDSRYVSKVEEHVPDKVFILDMPQVEQEFIDSARMNGADVVWIDHHMPLERDHVKHFNPRYKGDSMPTSQMCYEIVKQDEWIAAVGTVSDWFWNDFLKEYAGKHPHLLSPKTKSPEQALFDSKLGTVARIMSFNMKGKVSEVMKSIRALLQVNSPEEILEQESDNGKLIYAKFEKIDLIYQKLLGEAMQKKSKDEILLFIYSDDDWSLTKDLSNELLYRNPEKVVIIGREKNGEAKMSIRARDYILQPIVEKALIGVEGYGGGHEHACGSNVKSHDLKRFLEQFREEMERAEKTK